MKTKGKPAGRDGGRILTPLFVAINVVAFLVYCNMALFFLLFQELRDRGVDPQKAGVVIAAFSVSVLLLRPLLSPFLHAGNARRWLGVGVLGVATALAAYPFCDSWQAFLGLRIAHGTAYVLMVCSAIAIFTACVPEGQSGRAFGILGTVTLLPYAVLPPVVLALSSEAGGYFRLVAWTAPVMLLALPLLVVLHPSRAGGPSPAAVRPTWPELKQNFKSPILLAVLALFLLLTTCFAVQFYFLAPFAETRGLAEVGLFFTLSTATEIGVRLLGGKMLDAFPKHRTMAAAALLIAACFLGLHWCGSTAVLLGLAVLFGLGWGVALPLFNALIFDLSPVNLRAFNTNMGMQAFQGGLMLGPMAGGFLTAEVGYQGVFLLCAGIGLAVAAGLWFLPGRSKNVELRVAMKRGAC